MVLGALSVAFGLIAILASFAPSTKDPGGTRGGGFFFIGVGVAVAGGGYWLIYQARKARKSAPPLSPEVLEKRVRRVTRFWIAYMAIFGVGAVGAGIGSLVYSSSLNDQAAQYRAALPCSAGNADAGNCISYESIRITSVDVNHGKSGETDTVYFTEVTPAQHKVLVRPGSLDSSPLHTGAVAVAWNWQGKVTIVSASGTDFPTEDNPLYSQGEWNALGITFLVIGVLDLAVIATSFYLRRRPRATTPVSSSLEQPRLGTGQLRSTADLLQEAGAYPLVIRPRAGLGRLLGAAAALAVFIPVVLFQFSYCPALEWLIGGGFTVVFGAIILWQLLYHLRGGLFVDAAEFGQRRQLGQDRVFPRSEAGRLLVRRLVTPGSRTQPLIGLVESPSGRILMRFPVMPYGLSAVAFFGRALAVPVDGLESSPAITANELAEHLPAGPSSLLLKHPRLLGGGIAVVLIVVIGTVAIVAGPATHR